MQNRSFLALIGLAVFTVAGCDKGPTGPGPIASVELTPAAAATLTVGDSLKLAATLRTGSGTVDSQRAAEWTSTAPSIASVSQTGLVRALTVGNTLIIATAGGKADTVAVQVTPNLAAACDGATQLNLQPGEVFSAEGAQATLACLSGGAGAEYVYVPFNASAVASATLNVELNAGGTGVITPSLNPAPFALANLSLSGTGGPRLQRDDQFELGLRRQEIALATPERVAAARAWRQARSGRSASLAAAVPQEGDLLSLNVQAGEACTNPVFHPARVVAVTNHAVVAVDTLNPMNAGVTDEEYRAFGLAFDTLVYDLDVTNFGAPTDIDNNGKVIILYTRAVNELTEANSNSFVGGFFFGRDLYPRTASATLGACAGSNVAEIMYLLAPDPNGEINNNKRSADLIRRSTIGTTAHELQHLINSSRRLYINAGATPGETVWLNEGLSHIAEELLFYKVSGLQPRLNITIADLRASPKILDAFNNFGISNFGRFIQYLRNPADESLIGIDNLPTRGAIWAFLRYAADRKDGPDQPFWFALVNSPTNGLANLRNVLRTEPLDYMQNWTVSVYTDDEVPGVAPQFMQPSWNFRSIMPAFQSVGTYPLNVIFAQPGTQVGLTLQGGGAAFVRFGVGAGRVGAIRTTSGGAVPPQKLRVSIVRTK